MSEHLTAIAQEYLTEFADMGVEQVIVVAQGADRASIAVKRRGRGCFIEVTDFIPDDVFRETMRYVVANRHAFFRGLIP